MSDWGNYFEKVLVRAQEMDSDIGPGQRLLSSVIMDWSEARVGEVLGLLIAARFDEVRRIGFEPHDPKVKFKEELIVFEVEDKNGHARWILVYDNEELWQDLWVRRLLIKTRKELSRKVDLDSDTFDDDGFPRPRLRDRHAAGR